MLRFEREEIIICILWKLRPACGLSHGWGGFSVKDPLTTIPPASTPTWQDILPAVQQSVSTEASGASS
jgi:hypothetical protein